MNDRTEALLAEAESKIAKHYKEIRTIADAYEYYEALYLDIRDGELWDDALEETIEAIYQLYQNHKNNECFAKAYKWFWQFDVEFLGRDELERMAELYEKNKGLPAFEDYHSFLIENGVYEYLD